MIMEKKKPNILIFMVDQMQAQVTLPEHPCCMPNLNNFAEEGLSFTSAYTPMAHCCPSRASLMTGLYPSQHGIYNNVLGGQVIHSSLNPGVEMFSEKLRAGGYDLYYTGKWHVSGTEDPSDRGWEELYVGAPAIKGKNPFLKKMKQKYKELHKQTKSTERNRGEIVRPGWGNFKLYDIDEDGSREQHERTMLDKGIEKLKKLDGSKKPWCLQISLDAPHDPFIVPEKYVKMYNPDDITLPPNYHDEFTDKPVIYKRMRKVWSQLSDSEVKESIAYYWGFCTMIDDMFGEVLDTLEKTGQKDNTLVIFLSDHGEHLGAHGIYLKGISTFDEGYRIPCIMRWPDNIEKGLVVDEFVTLMDIAPTLIEVSGVEKLNKCSGRSLVPFFKGEASEDWRKDIYTQCNGVEIYYTQRMVKDKKYKFVHNPSDIDELYDLENDPYEMINIIDDISLVPIKKKMMKRMWQYAFETEDTIFSSYPSIALAEYGPGIAFEEE